MTERTNERAFKRTRVKIKDCFCIKCIGCNMNKLHSHARTDPNEFIVNIHARPSQHVDNSFSSAFNYFSFAPSTQQNASHDLLERIVQIVSNFVMMNKWTNEWFAWTDALSILNGVYAMRFSNTFIMRCWCPTASVHRKYVKRNSCCGTLTQFFKVSAFSVLFSSKRNWFSM